MVISVNDFQVMPDMGGYTQGLGKMIQQQLAGKLSERALAGDERARVSLASVDPNQANQLGRIFQEKDAATQRQAAEAKEAEDRKRMIVGRASEGYLRAKDKKGYMAATASTLRQAGFEDLAAAMEDSLQAYDTNPAAVDAEFQSTMDLFGQANNSNANMTQSARPVSGTGDRIWSRMSKDGTLEYTNASGVIPPEKVADAIAAAEAAFAGSQRNLYDNRQSGTTTGKHVTESDMRDTIAETASTKEQAVVRAREEEQQRIAMIDDAMDNIGAAYDRIGTIDEAIAALDAGARSGPIMSRFASLRAPSIELENIKNRLGLSVIAMGKFGALSEGEMRMALQTGMPDNLPPKELKDWLVRQKAATQKTSDAMRNAVQFFEMGGTKAQLARMTRDEVEAFIQGRPQQEKKTETGDTITTGSEPSLDDLLKQYGD